MKHKSQKTTFSHLQVSKLQAIFDQDSTPGTNVKRYLAHDLGLEPKAVMVWFNNRATRGKRKNERLISRTVNSIKELKYEPLNLNNTMVQRNSYGNELDLQKSLSNTTTNTPKVGFKDLHKRFLNPANNINTSSDSTILTEPNLNNIVPYFVNDTTTFDYYNLKLKAINNLFGTIESELRPTLTRPYHVLKEQDFVNFSFIQKIFSNNNQGN